MWKTVKLIFTFFICDFCAWTNHECAAMRTGGVRGVCGEAHKQNSLLYFKSRNANLEHNYLIGQPSSKKITIPEPWTIHFSLQTLESGTSNHSNLQPKIPDQTANTPNLKHNLLIRYSLIRHPQLCNLNSQPTTLHPQPYTLHPTPLIISLNLQILHLKPQILNCNLYTLISKP